MPSCTTRPLSPLRHSSCAVLAANVTDAQALIQEFYGRSGMSSKMINGVHTLFRSAAPNVPGAIRTVTVTNVVLVTSPTAAVPVAASTSAPATAAAAPVAAAATRLLPPRLPQHQLLLLRLLLQQLPAPRLLRHDGDRPSVIDATASPAATTAVTDTTTATVAATVPSTPAPTLKAGGRGRKTLTVDASASTQTAAPVVSRSASSTT